MTTPTAADARHNANRVGERVELGRYTATGAGERILYGQRVKASSGSRTCP